MITELELCAHVSIHAETQRINLQRNTKKRDRFSDYNRFYYRFYNLFIVRASLSAASCTMHARVKPVLHIDINSDASYGNVSICPDGDPAQ